MYKFSNKEHTAVTNLETGASGIHPGVWMWANYQEWVKGGGVTEPFDTRTVQDRIDEAIATNKANCKNAILTKYSAETQRNAALGLYDYDEAFKPAMADFIARCIALEDSTADGLLACTTIEQVTGYQYTPYPTE